MKEEIKKNNRTKRFVLKSFLFFLVIYFFYLSILFLFSFFSKKNYPAVIFFDVGQGDSILLRNVEGRNILIDAGPDNMVLKKMAKHLTYFSRSLDLVIVSHYHDDHVVGLVEIVKRYKVKEIIFAKDLKSSLVQDLVLTTIDDKNLKKGDKTKVFFIEELLEINLSSNCSLFVLNPLTLKIKDNDNNSLITKLDCYDLRFLFSGDNEAEVEEKLLKSNFDLVSDVFKASHHGSKTSNTLDFLRAVKAKIFVVSSGKNNRFKHPAKEVVDRVLDLKMIIKRTDLEGDLVFPLNSIKSQIN